MRTAAVLILAAALSGCANLARKPAPKAKAAPDARPAKTGPRTDPAAQKNAYDLGMRLYSQEKYEEARKAWQDAIRLGSSTQLGKKAQEHLRKTEQILKTLKEIEKQ